MLSLYSSNMKEETVIIRVVAKLTWVFVLTRMGIRVEVVILLDVFSLNDLIKVQGFTDQVDV